MGCSLFQKKNKRTSLQDYKAVAKTPISTLNIRFPGEGEQSKEKNKLRARNYKKPWILSEQPHYPYWKSIFKDGPPVVCFFFCHSTATKTKVLKRYKYPTSSFTRVSYEEEFSAEYLAGPLTAYVSHFGKRKTEKWNARKWETRRSRYNSWGSSRVACVPPLAYARVLCPLSGCRRNKRLTAVCLKMHFCLPFTVLENDD